MNVVFRHTALLLLTLVAVPATNVFAQREIQDRAAVIVAVESVDDILSDVSYLVGAAGFPEFVPLVTFGAGEYVRGLDREKPAGAYVWFDEETPQAVGFIAVTRLDDVLDTLSNNGFDTEKDGKFHLLTSPSGEEVYALEKDGWAFLSNNKDNLDGLPGDPAAAVGDMTDTYMISAKALLRNVPDSLRDKAIDFMKEGFENAVDSVPDEDMAEFQRKMNEQSMKNMIGMIEESDEIMMGWAVDDKNKRLFFDFELKAKQDTKLAKRLAAYSGVKSKFQGFLRDNAAVNMFYAMGMLDEDKQQMLGLIEEGRAQAKKALEKDETMGKQEKELVERMLKDVLDVAQATIETGEMNLGGSLLLQDSKFDFVMGGQIAEGKKFAESLKEGLDLAKEKLAESDEADKVKINKSVENHKGIDFHTIEMEVPDEEAVKIFGDKMTIAIGVGEDAAYMGIGPDGLESIKEAMVRMGDRQKDQMANMSIAFTPILEFALAASKDDPNVAGMLEAMVDKLKESKADKIVYSAKAKDNASSGRFEIQEGIIQLIGVGVAQAQRTFAGGGVEDF